MSLEPTYYLTLGQVPLIENSRRASAYQLARLDAPLAVPSDFNMDDSI
jgi:hypothetical protein